MTALGQIYLYRTVRVSLGPAASPVLTELKALSRFISGGGPLNPQATLIELGSMDAGLIPCKAAGFDLD